MPARGCDCGLRAWDRGSSPFSSKTRANMCPHHRNRRGLPTSRKIYVTARETAGRARRAVSRSGYPSTLPCTNRPTRKLRCTPSSSCRSPATNQSRADAPPPLARPPRPSAAFSRNPLRSESNSMRSFLAIADKTSLSTCTHKIPSPWPQAVYRSTIFRKNCAAKWSTGW